MNHFGQIGEQEQHSPLNFFKPAKWSRLGHHYLEQAYDVNMSAISENDGLPYSRFHALPVARRRSPGCVEDDSDISSFYVCFIYHHVPKRNETNEEEGLSAIHKKAVYEVSTRTLLALGDHSVAGVVVQSP